MNLPNKELLTKEQINFLKFFSQSKLSKDFKFSGGTALTTFYLPYRYSDDLDFFSENEVDHNSITVFLKELKSVLKFNQFTYSQSFNRNLYFLQFDKGYELKTEFTYFPFESIKDPLDNDGIKVDSIYDIAANKIFTISQNPRLRDYMDLYMILKRYNLDFNEVKASAQIKFGTYIEPIQLGSQLLKVNSLQDYPRVVEELPDDWKDYFMKLSSELGKKIIIT